MTKTPSTCRPVAASYIWAMGLPTLGMSAGMVTLLQYFWATPSAAWMRAVRRVTLEVLVGDVEFERVQFRDLEVGGSSAVGDVDAAVVDGDLDPVAHEATGAAGFGVVDEGEEVGARFVGTEHVGSEAGGCGGGLGLVGGLVGAADAGVES